MTAVLEHRGVVPVPASPRSTVPVRRRVIWRRAAWRRAVAAVLLALGVAVLVVGLGLTGSAVAGQRAGSTGPGGTAAVPVHAGASLTVARRLAPGAERRLVADRIRELDGRPGRGALRSEQVIVVPLPP